jgi:superfamily II DNA or RNA helicase
MIQNNIYERLPLFKLQEIVGISQLENIRGVLEALNNITLNPELIYTKGFLAAYARSNLNVKYLFSPEGSFELINTLNDEEMMGLAVEISGINLFSSREDFISNAVRLMRKHEYRKPIADFLGLGEFINFDSKVIKLPTSIKYEESLLPYKPLKDYQFEVYFQANEKLGNIDSRFILQMPTGSGKTRTAIEIVCEYLNNHPNGSVIWLAHSTELCDQASECFSEVWPHLAKRPLNFHRHYGNHKLEPIADQKIDFLCSSFQSLLTRVDKNPESLNGFFWDHRLIIVDEAHKVVAPTYQRVTRALLSDGSAVIGLTATPGRSYGALNTNEENRALSDFFFNTHISFNPHGQSAIQYLRNKGVLAHADFEPLMITGENFSLTNKELDYVSRMFELPPELLTRLGKSHLRNAEILNKLVDLVRGEVSKSVIFFATSLEQSRLIASLLNFLGIHACHIDGSTPSLLRQELITKFRTQKINVLCNYEVLATGFDAPLVDCVFIARPTASVVLYSQMIGRGLRGPAIGGKAKCRVVNVRDNILNLPSIDAMYSIFDEYWV